MLPDAALRGERGQQRREDRSAPEPQWPTGGKFPLGQAAKNTFLSDQRMSKDEIFRNESRPIGDSSFDVVAVK